MKRLFLSSQGLTALPSILSDKPGNLHLVFIPTAADPYKNKWFVDLDRKKLKHMGFNFNELDINGKTKHQIKKALKNVDVIYVAGGNTFYLLEKARESGFDKVVVELVNNGVLYCGVSAGAILAGPSIEQIKYLDNPSVAPKLKSYEGLGLVDFVTLPHWKSKQFKKEYALAEKELKNCPFPTVAVTNNEAIIVEDDTYHIVKS